MTSAVTYDNNLFSRNMKPSKDHNINTRGVIKALHNGPILLLLYTYHIHVSLHSSSSQTQLRITFGCISTKVRFVDCFHYRFVSGIFLQLNLDT